MNYLGPYLDILVFWILASMVWVVGFWALRELREDAFRQRLFCLRDELFDRAADGAIAFNHPAYRMVRDSINAQIRFAHRVNFRNALIAAHMIQRGNFELKDSHERLSRACLTLKPEAAELVQGTHRQMQFIILKYLMFGAPVLFFVMAFAVIRIVIRRLLSPGAISFDRLIKDPARYRERLEEELVSSSPRIMRAIENEAERYEGAEDVPFSPKEAVS